MNARDKRTIRAAQKSEKRGIRASLRAHGRRNKIGRGAIREGKIAERCYRKAQLLLRLVEERIAAKGREKRAKKITKDWWKTQGL